MKEILYKRAYKTEPTIKTYSTLKREPTTETLMKKTYKRESTKESLQKRADKLQKRVHKRELIKESL